MDSWRGVVRTLGRHPVVFELAVVVAGAGLLTGPAVAAGQEDAGEEEPPSALPPSPRADEAPPEAMPDTFGAPDWPEGLGPFVMETDAGDRLRVAFIGQIRLTSRFGPDRDARTVLETRRLRTLLQGFLLDERLRFGFQINTSPASLELFDVWVSWQFPQGLSLRVGQFKVPFTRYRAQSFSVLTLVDWGINTRMFGGERQLGAMVTAPGDAPLRFSGGVFTGQNARNTHGVGTVDVYGERRGNPSDLRDPAPPDDIHPELFAAVGRASPDLDIRDGSDATGGPLRGLIEGSLAWDLRPNPAEDFAFRAALETLIKAHGWGLTAAAYVGLFEPTEAGGVSAGALSGVLELDRRLGEFVSVAFRYAHEERLDPLLDDAVARAARLAVENPDDPNAQDRLDRAGVTRRRQETALGVNFYVIGHDLAIQLDGSWLRSVPTAGDADPRNDGRIRLQLQIRL